jgi:hypothetical protein
MKKMYLLITLLIITHTAYSICAINTLQNDLPGGAFWQPYTDYTVIVSLNNTAGPSDPDGFNDSDFTISCLGAIGACNTLSYSIISNTADHNSGYLGFTVSQISSVPPGVNPNVQIRVTISPTAPFSACSNLASKTFMVQFLPVEYVSFDVKLDDTGALLNWVTASESDNEMFVVERSSDGKNFDAIGKVTGAGTTQEMQNYQFKDETVKDAVRSPVAYYRLKQMDFDGSYTYSKTISLFLSKKDRYRIERLRMSGDALLFDLLSELEGKAVLSIYGINGNLMYSSKFNFNRGTEQITEELGDLPAGLYYLSLNLNGHNFNARFVKVD